MLADRSAAPARAVVMARTWKDAKAKYPKKVGETVKAYDARLRGLVPTLR